MPTPVTLLGVAPGKVPATGGGLSLSWATHPTPFGQAFLAVSDRGISSLVFLDSAEELLQLRGARRTRHEAPLTLERALEELERAWPGVPMLEDPEGTAATLLSVLYAGRGRRPGGRTLQARRARGGTGTASADGPSDPAGTPSLASSPTDPLSLYVRGTGFQLQVWRALLEVPPGQVTTYGRLAEALGRPGAARAVGSAVAANPVAYLIPCHRVVRASGDLGGYRWGVERKRAMLEWEGAGASGRG
jgi:AraC family transcriptional regulator, regulatory protein of adaptative response / methylated-DNA-[protein]-cysteine methyltransferase